MTKVDRELVDAFTREAVDQGKIIEAGWLSFKHCVIVPEASTVQLEDMRRAFFAGAQHLWGSIFSILDEDDDVSANDENRMSLINKELGDFIKEIEAMLKTGKH